MNFKKQEIYLMKVEKIKFNIKYLILLLAVHYK